MCQIQRETGCCRMVQDKNTQVISGWEQRVFQDRNRAFQDGENSMKNMSNFALI